MSVVSDAVGAVGGITNLFLIGACDRVIAVKAITCTCPIVSLTVAIDKAGAGRRVWMTNNIPRSIEPEHTTILNSTQCGAVVSHGKRGHATAYGIVLVGKSPTCESHALIINKVKALTVTAYP